MLAIRCLGRCLSVPKVLYSGVTLSKTYSTEATMSIVAPFKLYNLDSGPDLSVKLTRQDALKMLEQMVTVRQIELMAGELYRANLVRGFCHLYLGQEACCVGMKSAMREQDSCITAYRCHGWAYLMDATVEKVLAELAGRKTGLVRGKGGSMHMYTKKFYGGNGIVGAQVPVGTGVALAYKYRGEDGVCLSCYGDGAANQGQVFESYNIAKLWELPIVYVCENNHFGMGTANSRSSANTQYFTRCEYIPGIWVDGMNLLAVREATRFAIAHCSANRGPIIMELCTYRYSGHSVADPGTAYRTRQEVQEVRNTRDPITRFRDEILSKTLVTEPEVKEIQGKVKQIVSEIAKKVVSETEPGLEEMAADVYYRPLREKARGVSPFQFFEYKTIGTPNQELS